MEGAGNGRGKEAHAGADCEHSAADRSGNIERQDNACSEPGSWHHRSDLLPLEEYGGLKVDQAKRLKELEQENGKLKRLVAELSLDKQILQDIARGNF